MTPESGEDWVKTSVSLRASTRRSVIVLRSSFLAHFFHQLTDCFAFWHKTHFLSHSHTTIKIMSLS